MKPRLLLAIAAADFETSFSDSGSYAWEGGTATSVSPLFDGETCTSAAPAGRYCEKTLVELKTAGTLTVVIDGWNEDSDLDLFLHASDAEGTWGEEVAAPPLASGQGPEKITAKNLKPGFYIVGVNYFQSVEANYKGTATFAAAGGTTTTPAPTPAPAPTATPAPSPATPGALPASGKLAVQVRVDKSRIGSARKKGLPVRVGCTVQCKGTLTVKVDKRTARKLRLGRKATTIGRGSFTVTRKDQPALRVRLTAKARRKLAKAKAVKLTVRAVATDSGGGQKTAASARATLKR